MSVETYAPAASGRPQLDNIQALRGIAAMAVVVYHIALFTRDGSLSGGTGLVSGIWDRGWIGVDLFFVISGFIMVWTTQTLRHGASTVGQFLWRRATRIYPLWWVCAAIMAVYFMVSYGIPAAPDRVDGTADAWAYAAKSMALIPQDNPPLLGVGWTLIHEMWFYIVFAGALFLPRKYLPWILLGWAGVTLAVYGFAGPMKGRWPIRYVALSPLNLEFIAGAAVGLWLSRPRQFPAVLILMLSAVAILAAMISGVGIKGQSHHFGRTMIYAVPMAGLIAATTQMRLQEKLSTPRVLTALGDVSYSLYLTHYIVLIALGRVMRIAEPYMPNVVKIFAPDSAGLFAHLPLFALAIGVSLLVSAIFYRLIERPVISFFKSKRKPARSPAQMSD